MTQIKTLRDEELQADINPEAALRSDGNSGTHCMLDVHFIGVALCELSKLLRNVREHSPEPACSDSSAVDPRRTAVCTVPIGVMDGDMWDCTWITVVSFGQSGVTTEVDLKLQRTVYGRTVIIHS